MQFSYPDEIRLTAEQFYELFKDYCVMISSGRFSDFSEASALRVIGESEAIPLLKQQEHSEQKMTLAIADTIERFLKFPRNKGQRAVCTVRFQLERVYAEAFPVPFGYRFSIGNKVFQTQIDLLIPGQTDTADPNKYGLCRVPAIALEIGSDGNQPPQQAGVLQPIPGLLGLFIDEASAGGQDEEDLEVWFDRLAAIVAQANQRDTLIKESEFEQAAIEILGSGSIAIAVPELGADRLTKQIAGMHLFVANADGTAPTAAQLRQLSESFAPRAPLARGRLYFSTLTISMIDIAISCKVRATDNIEAIGNAINQNLRLAFSPSETTNMSSLEYAEAIYQVKLARAIAPVVEWGYVGDRLEGRNLPLPRLAPGFDATPPVKINQIKIVFAPNDISRTYSP